MTNNAAESVRPAASAEEEEVKTTCLTIVMGRRSSQVVKGGNSTTVPLVVWATQKRLSQPKEDPHLYNLVHYEFLDDIRRWTHLDQLLLQTIPSTAQQQQNDDTEDNVDVHLLALEATANNEKAISAVQSFLEERLPETASCHFHERAPPDNAMSLLQSVLLEDALLAFRGNRQLTKGSLLYQALSLHLTTTTNATSVDKPCMKLIKGVLESHLLLDHTAAQAIHLLPPPNAGKASIVGGTSSNNSIYGLLSKPLLTNMGKHKLQVWLQQPLISLPKIQERQDAISALFHLGKDAIRDALRGMVDMHKLAQSLDSPNNSNNNKNSSGGGQQQQQSSLQTMYRLWLLASQQLPALLEATDEYRGNDESSSSSLLRHLHSELTLAVHELSRASGLVETVLDLDLAPQEFRVQGSFAPELASLAQEMDQVQQQAQDEWEFMQEEHPKVKLESCDLDNVFSWQFRLPNANDIKRLNNNNGMQTHRILKNGVYFSTKPLRALSAQYQELQEAFSQQSRQIVQDAMSVAGTYASVVEKAAQVVATYDVLCGLAYTAAYSPHGYCKPTLTDGEEDGLGIELKAARHPCVELQEDVEFIPNDFSLTFGKSNFLMVTGPNMGGKSTYIRSLGAIVCMAQIGSYVPCESATINLCHAILARVGAGDLQERGISTFMAEMLEAGSILKTATKRSLIIIDELGRGTSTFDGYGLARAISEHILQNIGCMVVFATHFHELTAMPGIQNCHVTAQTGQQGLTFLYQVQPGPCLESFGIQVAEMAHVPACVIEDAKRKAKELEQFDASAAAASSSSNKKKKIDENIKFCQTFGKLDLPLILDNGGSFSSEEQKQRKLLELLAQ